MPVIKAKNYYMGTDGGKRMNCAQAILSAFKDKFDIEEDLIQSFKSFGHGKAPAGLCGAYYAVKSIVEIHYKEKEAVLEKFFIGHAGAVKCTSIRSLKKLSCVECVQRSAEFLEKIG